jgi:hypothetical protein
MTAPTHAHALQPRDIDPAIVRSIKDASAATSGDFGLMMAEAQQESGFRPDAKAPTSSATGLFQFIDSTWLGMVRRFGAKYGIGSLAAKIGADADGRPTVADGAARQQILDLRRDPQLSAALAGEFNQQNKAEVERGLGHQIGRAELYMAHFLGTGGATAFLKAVEQDRSTPGAEILPEAAAANRSLFYDGATGAPKSVGDIFHHLASRIERTASAFAAAASATEPTAAAEASAKPLAVAAAPAQAGASPSPFRWFSGLRVGTPFVGALNNLSLAALKLVGSGANAKPHPGLPVAPKTHRAV